MGEAVKGKGVRQGQDTRDTDGCYSYPLVDPRLEEAPDIDYSTVVQSTGADRSLEQSHNMIVNPLYSQHLHLRDDAYKGDRNKKSDRNKDDENKNIGRNTDDRCKANGEIKEWPGTRKVAKTRDIRYIRREDIGDDSDKDRAKKLNQTKANGGIEKGDINDTGVKDGEEQQNQATGNKNGCKEPVITNEEENLAKKITKNLAKKLAKDLTKANVKTLTGKIAKDLGEMVTKNLTRSGPCPVPAVDDLLSPGHRQGGIVITKAEPLTALKECLHHQGRNVLAGRASTLPRLDRVIAKDR